jgi:hypothetical protein
VKPGREGSMTGNEKENKNEKSRKQAGKMIKIKN